MNTDVPLTSKELRTQAESLLKEARTTERLEQAYTAAKEGAIMLGNIRDCLIAEGFTVEQAFELTKLMIKGGAK